MMVGRSSRNAHLIGVPLVLLLLFSLFGPVMPAHAATLCVAPGGAGGCYASIQAAINAASAGDTITVAAGTYAESVTINRSISLQGTSAVIQPAAGPAIALRSPAALPPPLANVTISGFTLDGSDGILIDKAWWGGVEALSVQNLTLDSITATGNTTNGLTIRSGAIVNGLTITNSHFDSNALNGIAITNTTTQVNNVLIQNTTISNNNQLGVYLLGPAMTTVSFSGTTVNLNGYEGMVIDNGAILSGLTITGSSFSSNGRITAGRGNGIGIAMPATSITGLTITGSTFASNRNVGIYMNRGTINTFSIQGSTFSSSTYEGIHIAGNSIINSFTLTQDIFQSNGGFGLLTRTGTGGLPVISALSVDGSQFNSNNNSGLALVGTFNGANIIRNNIFYNAAWEDLDIGVGWLGSPTTISSSLAITGNLFQAPGAGRAWASAYLDASTAGVANINFSLNCFNRTGYGLFNGNPTSVLAENNWWNNAGGPGAGGANVDPPVDYTPWGTSASVCAGPVVLYDINTVPAEGTVLSAGPTQINIAYNKDVLNDGSADAANNPANYLLVEEGANAIFDTPGCSGLVADDAQIVVDSVTYSNNAGAGPFVATLNIHGGVPLAPGVYRLYICGTTSVHDLVGKHLNDGLLDSQLNFSVVVPAAAPAALPGTGFAPGQVTTLPEQTVDYSTLGDFWMEIPKLGVQLPIIGVPQTNGTWDVSWLGNSAGWLQGTAFPTWDGNSVVTAHVWNADNSAGPFVYLNTLWYGDQVIVHAWGQQYVYEVRSVVQVRPDVTTAAFQHRDSPWLTLMTCRSFDADKGTYRYRVLVQAVLVSVK